MADKIEGRMAGLLAAEGLTLAGLEADAKRPVGRPRTRPANAAGISVYLDRDTELPAVNAAARRAGLSTVEWLRQVVLAAAKRK